MEMFQNLVCPIVVSLGHVRNWVVCDGPVEYLVQGTLLCRDHAMSSEIQKSYFPNVCGYHSKDAHVIPPGQHRCLCDVRQKD
jgi:hypothetical protein